MGASPYYPKKNAYMVSVTSAYKSYVVVGYLMRELKDKIAVAQSWNRDTGGYSDYVYIPKSDVRKKVELIPKNEEKKYYTY